MRFATKITFLFSFASLGPILPSHDERELLAEPEIISQHETNSEQVPKSKRVILKNIKGLSEMGDAEIIQFVSGKRLSNTPDGEFVGRLFVEQFDQSGLWIIKYNDRPPMQNQGIWSAKNNNLCVSAPRHSEQCRPVFINRNTGEIWMFEYNSHSRKIIYKIFILR